MITEEVWMCRALQLAMLGLGKVQPNPLVGAVIVHNDCVIGEGFHQQYGAPHAEVNAIYAVDNHELLKKSTLYVNLEPCSHYGKNPPCASLIIEKKIPKVVIGMRDPNQKVNGKGITMLKDAGVEVVENVLKRECHLLNKRFITWHIHKRPYIFLKWAQTKNGFMDIAGRETLHSVSTKLDYWITNKALRVWTHKMRSEEQAILVGYNTLQNDNPQLTNRLYGTNQPLRFVWCDERATEINSDSFVFLKGNINNILDELYAQNIQSVIVEGGKKTLQRFLDSNLWDEIFVLVGNTEWEQGVDAPEVPYPFHTVLTVEGDVIYRINPQSQPNCAETYNMRGSKWFPK